MSVQFDWSILSNKEVIQSIRCQLNQLANSDKNADKVGTMHITELNFGVQSPEIELVDVHDLSDSKVKTSFTFHYEGDATITFYSRVELNPLFSKRKAGARGREHMGVFDAHSSLTAPLSITLSHFRLEGKVVMGFEKPYLTVSLKNEALKDVIVNSSFDGCSAAPMVASVVRKNLMSAFKGLVANPIRVRLS